MWSEGSTKDWTRQDVYLKVASRAVHGQPCLNHSLPELWKSRSFFDTQNICHEDVWDLYLCPNALPPVRRLNVKIFHEHRLSLPRGVREEEKGKANKLQIWDGTDNKCSDVLSCHVMVIWSEYEGTSPSSSATLQWKYLCGPKPSSSSCCALIFGPSGIFS